ncbi:MAG: hypothetical protein IJU93_09615 [Lachnospiraceae bacterium]|nr:hypothetical protein [Lachnospiraceae bacterium]
MTVIEIVLLILGALIFAASFIIPEKLSDRRSDKESGMGGAVNDINAREMVETMKEDIERQVRLAVDTSAEAAVEDAVLRSERNIERVTNEKMMAIDEYAQTVIQDINKNHKEVVFLYDMLDNKTADIKNTVRKAEGTKSDIEEAAKKVRSELEAIAKRSAETVIANSARTRSAKAEAAAAPEREQSQNAESIPAGNVPAGNIPVGNAPVREQRKAYVPEPEVRVAEPQAEPEILQQVTASPRPAAAPRPAKTDVAAEVQAVENSMKEKGVPKLGRALAAAFAQATMTSAAQEEEAMEPAMEQEPQPQLEAPVAEAPVPVYNEVAAEAPAPREIPEEAVERSPLSDLYAAANPAYTEEQSEAPDDGDVVFSNVEDLQGLVISMHRQGIDDVEIAKRLSIGVGEVKLMIGLYAR